jgi:hypothetical protein
LFALHPDVAVAVAGVPPERLGDAVRAVATDAAQTCGVLELCEDAVDLDRLVADLDDIAWRAQVSEERGDRPGIPHDEAFRRARATESWRQAAVASNLEAASDAIYEALHALGADSEAEARVVEVLTA